MNKYNLIIKSKHNDNFFFQSIIISANTQDQAKMLLFNSKEIIDICTYKIDTIESLGWDEELSSVKILEVSGRSYFS